MFYKIWIVLILNVQYQNRSGILNYFTYITNIVVITLTNFKAAKKWIHQYLK
jgi:hypothetical protein